MRQLFLFLVLISQLLLQNMQHIFFSSFSLPGKQLFEKDHNLDTSDIQFLEDGNSSSSFYFAISVFFIYFLIIFISTAFRCSYEYLQNLNTSQLLPNSFQTMYQHLYNFL